MSQSPTDKKIAKIMAWTIAAVMVLIPFHALFTAWIASGVQHYDLIRIWKELLLVPLGLGAIWIIWRDKKVLEWFLKTRLLYLIGAYITLFVICGVLAYIRKDVNQSALIYGLLSGLRFPLFFAVCIVAAAKTNLYKNWRKIIIWPALIVIAFGLLQLAVLPDDFLRHFGYDENTIVAVHTIDQKLHYVRIQSTLRGPNPLGAYLVMIIPLLAAAAIIDKRRRNLWLVSLGGALPVLLFTYSRSAWLGLVTAAALLAWWMVKNPAIRKLIVLAGAVVLLVAAVATLSLRNNDYFQNTVFHTDEHSASPDSSNDSRASALGQGLADIKSEPWGRGPGTAGPASVRNNHSPRLAENYYLQIAQEVGIVGLVIFIGIMVIAAAGLYKQGDVFSLALLSSLAGLAVINLISHAWADDTIAYLWWGAAGIALGSGILNKKRTKNEVKTKEKTKKRSYQNS